MTAAAVEVSGLTRRFGGVTAVDGVSFAVNRGEVFGIIGPNGAGKTTLFNLVTGITPPTSGALFHDGTDITSARPYHVARRGIARTFQNIRLFAELSALENVMIGRHCHTRSGLFSGVFGIGAAAAEERAVRQRGRELLALMGLATKAHVKARNLPYGDQRRLEIARALALDPKVLLLDEPAAGMNPTEKAALSDFLRRLRADFDLTLLIIEHHVPLVMGLCDRIAVLDFGRLIALGDPETVRRDPAVVEAYLGEEG
ncbi:MAG TPA: ABC transporter ATP-binding protein [Acidimicrobiia bacterium]|nr:ABC transporter ATP-binding protein [Acidimicrobiia bacterium]